jgi:hypothetical protein
MNDEKTFGGKPIEKENLFSLNKNGTAELKIWFRNGKNLERKLSKIQAILDE